MKPRHLAAWTALLLILALGAGGIWQASHATAAHHQALAEAEQSHARLRTELDRLRQSATAVERAFSARSPAAPRPAPVVPAAPARPSPPPPPDVTQGRSQWVAGNLSLTPLISDPQRQALRLEADRAMLATNYAVFFTAQGLDSSQQKRFADAIIEHNAAQHDLELIREAQKLPYDDPVMAKSREKFAAELRAAQAALLDEAGLAALQTYDRTISLRAWVNGLAGTLALADAPLTLAQGEALVQALATAQSGAPRGGAGQMRPADWTAFEAVAPTILTPAQLPLLQADNDGSAMGRFGGQIMLALRPALERHAAAKADGKK